MQLLGGWQLVTFLGDVEMEIGSGLDSGDMSGVAKRHLQQSFVSQDTA